jgi:hypothetical protein
VIYFMSINDGTIKVGITNNVGRRLKQHQYMYGDNRARILGVHYGERYNEKEILRRFSHLRIGKTEQLNPSPELLAYIEATTEPWIPGRDNWFEVNDWVLSVPVSSKLNDWLEAAAIATKTTVFRLLIEGAARMAKSNGYDCPIEFGFEEPAAPIEDEMEQLCGLA